MSSATIDSSSMLFDPYATSFDTSQLQTYPELSPVSIFDTEDFGTDLASDSAASPLSPLSPALSASSFGFPATDIWANWDAAELSPEPDNLFGCQTFASCPPSHASLSPAINPIDLTVPASANTRPLPFQSPQIMLATMPSQQLQSVPMTAALPTPPTPSTTPPTTDPAAKRYPSRGLKRKSTSGPSDEEPAAKSTAVSPSPGATMTTTTTTHRRSTSKTKDAPTPAPKKSAHNMIEKRYRTNLNDKIAQLRDAVPSLRLMAQRAKAAGGGAPGAAAADFDDAAAEDGNGLLETAPGLAPCAKLNKATILSKATEYILQLERRNQGLEAENSALRGRMEGLEIILTSSGRVAGGWN